MVIQNGLCGWTVQFDWLKFCTNPFAIDNEKNMWQKLPVFIIPNETKTTTTHIISFSYGRGRNRGVEFWTELLKNKGWCLFLASPLQFLHREGLQGMLFFFFCSPCNSSSTHTFLAFHRDFRPWESQHNSLIGAPRVSGTFKKVGQRDSSEGSGVRPWSKSRGIVRFTSGSLHILMLIYDQTNWWWNHGCTGGNLVNITRVHLLLHSRLWWELQS